MNAHAVNRGEMPKLSNNKKEFFFLNRRTSDEVLSTVADLCTRRLPKNMGIPPEDIQVLSPSRQYAEGVLPWAPYGAFLFFRGMVRQKRRKHQ